MQEYVKVSHISKHFGSKRAVHNVSFKVNKGDVLGFLGPNGAGKTTTMRMITGSLSIEKGAIDICGYSVTSDGRNAARHIGYLPEGVPLYSELSPRKFLSFFGRARGLSGTLLDKRLDYVREQLNLDDVFDQAIDTLSKGYKRRVGFAQAILHDPKVLVLDEPTDGLDPMQKHEVRELIRKLSSDKAVIISTHILEEVESVCNRAVIISRGAILFNDTPAAFIAAHPKHDAVRLEVARSHQDKAATAISAHEACTLLPIPDNSNGDTVSFYVKGKDSHKTLTALMDISEKEQLDVFSLSIEKGSYDEVFRDIVTGKKTPATPHNSTAQAQTAS